MGLDNSAYYKILKDAEWSPLSYKEIANSLMKNGVKQMYHAILNEDDIQFFFPFQILISSGAVDVI